MYLEKLEIQGFKSFANKNKLIFSGLIDKQKRGLTAVVGPNGSGKSNVADAIRWALGEQSLKTLRGKKSEDVIFSGSDQRHQLGMAEVSLFLNNSEIAKTSNQGPESIEKESDLDQIIRHCSEIVITRRLYRSGESEYLLNGNRVRLTDIQMLLAKANFGQKTYSVIGQGMVENFLSSSAAERKDFFDEATGVKQFQIKRDAALNKLESSYENLQQVDMLLSEIKPRLKSLTRQVEKLKKRSEIESELKEYQLNYYGYLWQDINQKLDSSNARFLGLEKVKLEKEKKLGKLNEELHKIRSTDNFREINELQPRLRELENQRNQYLKQLDKLQASFELQLEAQGQFDVSWLTNKQGELKTELTNIKAEILALENNSREAEEKALNEDLSDINRDIEKCLAIRREAESLETEKAGYFKQIARLEAILEANLEIQGQFDVSWLTNKQGELQAELTAIDKEIISLKEQGNRQNEELLQEKLKQTQTKLGELSQELNKLNQELKKSSHTPEQKESIGQLVAQFLSQLDEIEKESNLEKIKQLITAAKQNFQAKISSLISTSGGNELNKVQEVQTEIIRLTEERQKIADQLNGEKLRLSTVNERMRLLVQQQDQLIREAADIQAKLAKAQIKFDAAGLEAEKSAINKKIKNLNQEISQLLSSDNLSDLQNKKQQIIHNIQEVRLKISSLNERQRLLQNKEGQITREMEDIELKIIKSQTKIDHATLNQERKNINTKLDALNEEIKKIEESLEIFNRAQEKEKAQMFDCQTSLQSAQQELNILLNELNQLKVEATRQETKLEDLENNIRNDELEISAIKNHKLTESTINLELWQKRLSSHKIQLEQIGGIDPETEKEYQETKERYDFLSQQTNDLNQAIKSLEEVIYELDVNIKDRFDLEFKIISEKFNEYFKILFNGGTAKISKLMIDDIEKESAKNTAPSEAGVNDKIIAGLTPEEISAQNEVNDKLKRIKFLRKHNAVGLAGIDIQATPPGKKIQTVAMLSGGERALTAIALICAIISANPSPFVVLDEVDAALDEANSERLAQILDDLSNKTQFIVITHNRASMRKASILYGVTMESDGVSKLLSVKLEDIKSQGR